MTRQLWIADKLRAYGLTVVEITGWQDRARPGAFDPRGVIAHHTAGPKGKDHPSLQVCIDGRTGLAGPLCNVMIGRNCTCYVISAGRCNHAGEGAWGPFTDGNRQFMGIEAENDGLGEPWTPKMLDTFELAAAALLDGLGQPRGPLIAHREWAPTRKTDPKGIDMDHFRAGVDALLRKGTTTVPTTTSPASDAMVEQWQRQLLANGAQLGGGADGLFGRLTLEASTTVLNHRNQLLAQVGTQAERIDRMLSELSTTKAEVEQLRALADVATKAPALLAIVMELQGSVGQAVTKLQGL